MSGCGKGKKRSMKEGGKARSPFSPLEVTSAGGGHWRGVGGTMWGGTTAVLPASLSAPLWPGAVVPNQDTHAWYLETGPFLPTLAPTCCVQTAPGTVYSCQPHGWGWGRGSYYHTVSYKLTKISWNLPSKPSSGSCRTSLDSRVSKELYETDCASAIVAQVKRRIPDASYSGIFSESSFQHEFLGQNCSDISGMFGKPLQKIVDY